MKYPDVLWYYLNKNSLKRTETDELYNIDGVDFVRAERVFRVGYLRI